MDIRIPLKISGSCDTYEDILRLLKQLELSIHYAQKSVKSAQENGLEITAFASFVCYKFSRLDKAFEEENYDQLQEPELQIFLDGGVIKPEEK